jgi:transcriptional regulator with XRE-family HTH domain
MANRLKTLREAAGLTQADVAQRLGMSLSGYQRKETAKRGMNLAFAERLGRVLGVPAAAVLEAAGAPAEVSPEEAEVLRLWAKLSTGNRDALLRMLRLAAAEGDDRPGGHAAPLRTAVHGMAEPQQPAPTRRKPCELHDVPPPPRR